MASSPYRSSGQVPCSYHPNVMTGLRCSRCGKPICPQCAVRTPVGLRCPDCAGVRGLPTYQTPAADLLKAVGLGLLVAVGVAILWRFFPLWQFYLCILLGFGAVETMARTVKYKRGVDMQIAAIAVVVFGMLLARALLAQRYGISLGDINSLNAAVITPEALETGRRTGDISVAGLLQLNLIPDLLYALIPIAVAFVRFR